MAESSNKRFELPLHGWGRVAAVLNTVVGRNGATVRHSINRFQLAVVCGMGCLFAPILAAQTEEAVVQLEIQCTAQESVIDLIITVRNSGTKDTAIVLGEARGNGQVYLPSALYAVVNMTGDAKEHNLFYFNRAHAFVAGRVDPWIVPLPATSSFSVSVQSEHLWSSELNASLKDMPAISKIRLGVVARAIEFVNADTTGLKLMHLFVGDVKSKVVDPSSDCVRSG